MLENQAVFALYSLKSCHNPLWIMTRYFIAKPLASLMFTFFSIYRAVFGLISDLPPLTLTRLPDK